MKKEKKKSVLTRIIPYAGKRKYMLFLAMAFSALSGILLLMPMWYIHNIIKNVILNGNVNYTMIRENIAYAVIFPCVGLGLYVLAGIFSHLFAFEVEENIIKISVKKLLDKPLGYFMNKESGKLRGIIINGAGETHNVLAHQLPDIASTFVSPVVILVFLFLFDWRLGLTSLIPVFIGLIFMATMLTVQGKKNREEYYKQINTLSAETVEYVRGIPVVKTFGQSVESFKRLYTSIIVMKDSVLKMTMGYRNKMSMFEATSGSTAFFLVPAALFIIAAGENPHEVVADSIIYFLIGPIFGVLIMRTATISQYLYFAELALDKIEDILDNISFKVNRGETVALVGRSGSGKTTIARLAARFYDADEGEVLLGGSNIKEYDKTSLMRKISFVFQNARLFKMSLRENLLCGKEDAIDKEIEQALFDAGAKEIVDGLKDGLETVYGTKGTYFSGGEAQRLVIARAFLKDAEYVILDEATAFADPENERIIQESFKKLAENKTTLLIAHRLSTVVNADKILVIEKGRIAEEGKHEALLEKNGIYKSLWDEYRRSVNWKIGDQL